MVQALIPHIQLYLAVGREFQKLTPQGQGQEGINIQTSWMNVVDNTSVAVLHNRAENDGYSSGPKI